MKAIKRTALFALVLVVALFSLALTACGKKLTGIEVTDAPAKIEYIEGQKFDPTGMTVTASYDNGEKTAVTDYSYEPSGELKTTDTQITVTYNGKTAVQNITVTAKAVTELSVTAQPTKTEYVEGEKFDKTGLKITAVYNDGTSAEITDYKIKPSRELCVNDLHVIVSADGAEINVPISVSEDPEGYDPLPVYRAVGAINLAEQTANINFTLYSDYTLRGLLESGMGATVDNMLGKFLDFPGVWEKNDESFTITLNTYIFDPQTLSGLAGFVPADMKDMFDMLMGLDPFEITGCTSDVTVGENNTVTFDATIAAMGFTAPVKGSGKGAPDAIAVASGEKAEAEWGDYGKMKSQSASSGILKNDANMSGGYILQYCGVPGNVWKMTVNTSSEIKGATLAFAMLGYKKGYNLNQYVSLKVNGKDVELAGGLDSISKFVEFETTADLVAGDNTLEIVWKDLPTDENGKEQKISNFKFDYVSFSCDVTVVKPTLV